MRYLSSCSTCRTRKKRCLPGPSDDVCSFCFSRKLICDVIDVETRRASAKAAQKPRKEVLSQPILASDKLSDDFQLATDSSLEAFVRLPLCGDLIDLYFDIFHNKQQILFHRITLLSERQTGVLPNYILLGIVALTSRFSTNDYFLGIDRHARAGRYLSVALRCFNNRDDLVSIHALQACILLSFVCFTEGRSDQEALLAAQAIRMVQLMNLPQTPRLDIVRRETEIRLFWQAMMMDTWNCVQDGLPRQLLATSSIPKPLNEAAFEAIGHGTSDVGLTADERTESIWTQCVLLTDTFAEVTKTLRMWVLQPDLTLQVESKVAALTTELDLWLHNLPSKLQNNSENFREASAQGFGREFAVIHLIYHHQCQLLFFPYLSRQNYGIRGKSLSEYVHRCKAHAASLSQLMWATNTTPKMECLWSPVNGHLLVVASTCLLHSLIHDQGADCVAENKELLEQNFVMLLQFQSYWPTLKYALSRLQAIHRYCSQQVGEQIFRMDAWMLEFLTNYSTQLPERPAAPDMLTIRSTLEGTDLDWYDLTIEGSARGSELNASLSFV